MENSRRHTQSGFTLIEVLVGMLIIAAAASSIFYGISYARAEIRKIAIRERAIQELDAYMEYWTARIQYGNLGTTDRSGGHEEEVVLWAPDNDDPKVTDDNVIIGTITRENISQHYDDIYNPNNYPYYKLRATITWVDHLSDNEEAEYTLETSVAEFEP